MLICQKHGDDIAYILDELTAGNCAHSYADPSRHLTAKIGGEHADGGYQPSALEIYG